MKKFIKNIVIVFISLVLFSTNSCELLEEDFNIPTYENSIKIGVVGDVSVLREQVESMFLGARLASEEINQKGALTINNVSYPIELIYKNSAGSAEEGLKIVDEFINEDIKIIVGPTFSSVAIEMAEKCIENDILMMTYSATTPEITLLEDKNLVWRTCPSDFTFGMVSATHCFEVLETRSAAILYRDDRFGIGLSDVIKETFINMGGDITNMISFPSDIEDITTYDFSYEINTLLDGEPDIIYIISITSESAILINKIYNNDLFQSYDNQPYIFVNDGVLPKDLIKNCVPEILETTIGITSTNTGNENYIAYKDNFTNRFGFTPSTYSEHAYDAIYLLAYAMQTANSQSPNVFKKFLRSVSGSIDPNQQPISNPLPVNINEWDIAKNIILKNELIDYEGASGSITFNEFGDPKPKIVIWGIENNEYVELYYYD